jgi:hypothetical protein
VNRPVGCIRGQADLTALLWTLRNEKLVASQAETRYHLTGQGFSQMIDVVSRQKDKHGD